VKKEFDIAVVGGSDLTKIKKQLGNENLFEKYKYIFAENGLIAFKDGKALPSQVSNQSDYLQLLYLRIIINYVYSILTYMYILNFSQFRMCWERMFCRIL